MDDIKSMKTLMTIDLDGVKEEIGDMNIPDAISLYDELIMSDNVDEDLDKAHALYSYCTILAEELSDYARVLEAKLEKWEAKKWRSVKASRSTSGRNMTDLDAKRAVEESNYRLKQKILISKYVKLSRQLSFGGGRAFDMKRDSIKAKLRRLEREETGGGIRSEADQDVVDKVKSKIKNRL